MRHVLRVALTSQGGPAAAGRCGPAAPTPQPFLSLTFAPFAVAQTADGTLHTRHSLEPPNSEARAGPRAGPGSRGGAATKQPRTRYRVRTSGKPERGCVVRGGRDASGHDTRHELSTARNRSFIFDLVNFLRPQVPWLRSVETCTRQGGAWSYHTVHPTATPPRLAFVVTVSGAFTRSMQYGSAEHRGERASTPVIFGRVRVGDSLVL
jgi:hypothetical protein